MANVDRPCGMIPVRIPGKDLVINRYYKGTSAGNVGIGDPVVQKATTTASDGVPEITNYTAGAELVGVVIGFEPDTTNLDQKYIASASTGYVLVCDDPDQIFEIQEVSGGTPLTIANVGEHADLNTYASCNTTTGRSVAELDNAAVATDNTLIIVGPSTRPDNEVGSAHQKWLVKINLHSARNAGATSIKEY